ncbi:MAG: MBL fold metallo-hydrolase [Oscillospiraceae bacterium]|nr:MBL fold metallo-hydrolase [Oscillospiraceae bacterium]
MIIKSLQVGQIGTNCYVIGDEATKEGAIIDPGDEAERILRVVQEARLNIQYILLTHGHFDHTTGIDGLLQTLNNVPVYIHPAELKTEKKVFSSQVKYYDDGATLPLGGLTIEVLHTPGHSQGSVVLKAGNVLFTGDTLFRGSCGRTDLYGGSYPDILRSLKRLYNLPGDYRVYPGHEGFTTLEQERKQNYFMQEAIRN